MIHALLLDIGEIIVRLDFSRLFLALGIAPTEVRASMDQLNQWNAYDAFERGQLTSTEFFTTLRTRFKPSLNDEALLKTWNSVITGEIPGIKALVKEVSQRTPVFGLTNASQPHLDYVKEICSACEDFREIFSSCELGLRKPEKEIYQQVSQAIKLPPDQILFIDDREDNVEGAKAIGMLAEQCLDSPVGLRKILERHGLV